MRTDITTTADYAPYMLDLAAYITIGRRAIDGWSDETQPRTDRPVRFDHVTVVPWAGERTTYRTVTTR